MSKKHSVFIICLSLSLTMGTDLGESPRAASAILQDISFNLTKLSETPIRHSLLISDGEENSISGIFTVDQLKILLAIMTEAEKFAFSTEATGAKDSITTRFEDRSEHSFIVDVEKLGIESRLYLTLNTEIGRKTIEAGKVNRATRKEAGFFFDLLSRLESMLPKIPAQSPK